MKLSFSGNPEDMFSPDEAQIRLDISCGWSVIHMYVMPNSLYLIVC